MIGMILAAGFGTRLRSMSQEIPKPLVPILGRPMLDGVIDRLREAGCRKIVINVHHQADQVMAHVCATEYGIPVEWSVESDLMGTGGALVHARALLEGEEPILLHNADIVSEFPLHRLCEIFAEESPLAVLAVRAHPTSRAILGDVRDRFLGKESWYSSGFPPEGARRWGFCGIHVLSPRFLRCSLPEGAFDIFDGYRLAMAQGETLRLLPFQEYWSDLGTPERLSRHEQHVLTDGDFIHAHPHR